MQITIIKNDDENKITTFKIARIIYAESGGKSLQSAEAIAAMIYKLQP